MHKKFWKNTTYIPKKIGFGPARHCATGRTKFPRAGLEILGPACPCLYRTNNHNMLWLLVSYLGKSGLMWPNLRVKFVSILSSFSLLVIRGQTRLATPSNLLFVLQTQMTTSTVNVFLRFLKWNFEIIVLSLVIVLVFAKDQDSWIGLQQTRTFGSCLSLSGKTSQFLLISLSLKKSFIIVSIWPSLIFGFGLIAQQLRLTEWFWFECWIKYMSSKWS